MSDEKEQPKQFLIPPKFHREREREEQFLNRETRVPFNQTYLNIFYRVALRNVVHSNKTNHGLSRGNPITPIALQT